MSGPKIVVFEYGAGNVHSACQALASVGADVTLTHDAERIRAADALLVPGVGAFGYVMGRFESRGGSAALRECQELGKPVFGICVGMQILFEDATEKGEHPGLGLLSGTVEELPAPLLPHMGWAPVRVAPQSAMFAGIESAYFYFVHSYARLAQPEVRNLARPGMPVAVSLAHHGADFVAAAETDRVWATQFHPEKSGPAGLRLLSNWLRVVEEN